MNTTTMKGRQKRKILAISAVLIALSSIAVTQGDKIKHAYMSLTQPEYQPEITKSQEYDTSTFQSLVEGPGVILTKDSLLRILGPSAENDIDAVTTATPFPTQSSDNRSN